MRAQYPGYEVVYDIGSGLNYRRKKFVALLERVVRGDIEEIVVADAVEPQLLRRLVRSCH
jgi:predicted site-specific integrase-resolvase